MTDTAIRERVRRGQILKTNRRRRRCGEVEVKFVLGVLALHVDVRGVREQRNAHEHGQHATHHV